MLCVCMLHLCVCVRVCVSYYKVWSFYMTHLEVMCLLVIRQSHYQTPFQSSGTHSPTHLISIPNFSLLGQNCGSQRVRKFWWTGGPTRQTSTTYQYQLIQFPEGPSKPDQREKSPSVKCMQCDTSFVLFQHLNVHDENSTHVFIKHSKKYPLQSKNCATT